MLWRGFQKPKRLAVENETLTDKYGKFSAQPFERGFGTTIGNALRRTLLSSIEGAAVTAVRIEGVLHEFQSITGVVEDATDIILNLKQIPFKLNGDGPKALYLRAELAIFVGECFGVDCETLGLLKTSPKHVFLLYPSWPRGILRTGGWFCCVLGCVLLMAIMPRRAGSAMLRAATA